MKRLKVKDAESCMACLQCAVACASAFYKKPDVALACIRITEGKTPRSIAVRTCIQCGKCARNCEAGAISQNAKGVYTIDKKLCVHCGKCVEVCPFGLIVRTNRRQALWDCLTLYSTAPTRCTKRRESPSGRP